MKNKLPIICFCISLYSVFSETVSNDELFKKALSLYDNKLYEESLKIFLNLKSLGFDNFEVNYNIGSVYFKQKKYGESRFYFERALLFNPYDSDLYFNLKTIYNILLRNPKSGEQEVMNKRVIFFIPKDYFVYIFSGLFVIMIIFIFVFIFREKIRKVILLLIVVLLIFQIILSLIFFIQYYNYNEKIFVVTEKTANVYLSPNDENSLILTISVGSKGKILNDIGNYIKINTSDGYSGWIKKNSVITNQ